MYIKHENSWEEERSIESIMAHKELIYINPDGESSILSRALTMTYLKNLESIGFTLDKKAIDDLMNSSPEKIAESYEEVFNTLRHLVGEDVAHKPMYPGFPEQVMNMEEAEFLYNALIHYESNGEIVVPQMEDVPIELEDVKNIVNLKKLTSIDYDGFVEKMNQTMTSATSLRQRDKEDISWYLQNACEKPRTTLPEEIPFKETALLVAKELSRDKETRRFVKKYVKTTTDVLRFVVALSDGDISLSKSPILKNFNNAEERLLFNLLEENLQPQEMLKNREAFLRLGEKLHTGTVEHRKQFPKTAQIFDLLRDNEIESIPCFIEESIKQGNYMDVVSILTNKHSPTLEGHNFYANGYNPGEFGNRLDKLIRMSLDANGNAEDVIQVFEEVAPTMSDKMLLRLKTHFDSYKDIDKDGRCFIPKGDASKIKYIEDDRVPIPVKVIDRISSICEEQLLESYSKKPSLGKVYIDDSIDGYLAPSTGRTTSDGFRVVERGSKIPFEDKHYITPFLHWEQNYGRTDVDLSVGFYTKDMEQVDEVNFQNPKTSYACHSGDFVSAGSRCEYQGSEEIVMRKCSGADEFISINLDALPKNVRYAMIYVNSYSGQKFEDMKSCYTGVQLKECRDIVAFESDKAETKIDLQGEHRSYIPTLIDLKEHKVIMLDINGDLPACRSISDANEDNVVQKMKAILNKEGVLLRDLVTMNAEARGEIVDDPREADIIFAKGRELFDEEKLKEDVRFCTPFDTSFIGSDLLGKGVDLGITPIENEKKIELVD